MIDKIKFYIKDYLVNEATLKRYKLFSESKKSKKYVSYLSKIDNLIENEIVEDFYGKKKEHRIKLTLVYNKQFSKYKLWVEGSIRKWYYGKDSTRDFNKKDFKDCIAKLANKLEIPVNILLNSIVTKIETGITLRLKPKHQGILNCINNYLGFKKHIFDDTTVKFRGSNYDLIFYNKIVEIYSKKDKLKRTRDKLIENNFFFRYEIQVRKLSGVPVLKNKANTLLKVKNNWKYLGQNLIKTLDDVEFINVISPEIYTDLKGKAIIAMSNYLIYQGIKSIGIENTRQFIQILNPKKRKDCRIKYKEIFERHLEKDKPNYEDIFRQEVTLKVDSLLK